MAYLGLVERLVDAADADPRPRPGDDTITEADDGEIDCWGRVTGPDRHDLLGPRPDGGIITKATGERNRWDCTKLFNGPRPGPDTITRQDAEADRWGSLLGNSTGPRPRPRPDDDTITFTETEADDWARA